MAAPLWMPLYIKDYRADTSRLSLEEHGAYLTLIMDYWQHGSLPTDDEGLARVLGVSTEKWLTLRPRIAPFFDKRWRHKRIDAERAKTTAMIEQASARGKKAAQARWDNVFELRPKGAG